MADKTTSLSIVIRTVDQATAKIKSINDRLDKITKPTRDFKKALGELADKSGFNGVVDGFKGVGSAIEGALAKVAVIGGIAGAATAELFHLVEGFDDLGKKSARLGVSADFLAGMRDAAARTGVPVEALDEDLQTFSQNLGQAAAHTGRMYKFLTLVNPAFRDQVVHAKSAAAAFDLVAIALQKETDPMRRAALAQKIFGDGALSPLLAKGAKGIAELREHYLKLAGSQEGAVAKSEEVAESLHDLHATTDGLKAALVEGLAPALKVIVDRLSNWFQGHREDVKRFAEAIGDKLPGAVAKVAEWLERAWGKATAFVDAIGGIKNAAIGVAAILAGPLIKSVVDLSLALLTAGGRAVALAKGVGSIPAGVGAAGGAAGGAGTGAAAGAAGAGGLGVIGSIAWPVALGFGAKYLLKKAGLDDLGGGDELARKAGPGVFSDWLREGGYASEPGQAPSDLVQNGIDSVRDASGRGLSSGFGGGGVMRGLTPPQNAKITIDIKNAPKGTRATIDPGSTADVDLGLGYQLGFLI